MDSNKWEVAGLEKNDEFLFVLLIQISQSKRGSSQPAVLKIRGDSGNDIMETFNVRPDAVFNSRKNIQVKRLDQSNHRVAVFYNMGKTILLAHFDKQTQSVTYKLEFTASKHLTKILFSEKQQVFVFNDHSHFHLFDSKLKHKLFSLELDSQLKIRFLSQNEDSLVLSSESQYLEISLLTFQPMKCTDYYLDDLEKVCFYGFDKSTFPLNQKVLSFCSQKVDEETRLMIFEDFDPMSIESFPLVSLQRCFKQTNYHPHVEAFSKYYFMKIKKHNNLDKFYGGLNPQLMWIYHNDNKALENSLGQYGYIRSHEDYLSPLEYSFKLNSNNCIRVICQHLQVNLDQISLSQRDFRNLLRSNYIYCHQLLSKVFREQVDSPISQMVYLQEEFKIYMEKDALKVSMAIIEDDIQKREIMKKYMKTLFWKEGESQQNLLQYDTENSSLAAQKKVHVDVFSPGILIDFKYGSNDSLLFMDNYSETQSHDFLASEWKYLVYQKWKYLRYFHLGLFLVYYIFMVLFMFSTIIFPEESILKILTLVVLGALFVFELLEIISFIAYRPSKYFSDFVNFVDIFILLGSIIYLLMFDQTIWNPTVKQVYGLCIHFVVYYRGFYYLKIFDAFTTIVGIINVIIIKIYSFFIIVVYFYLAFTALLLQINGKESIIFALRDIYIWAVFGGIESDSFEVYLSFIVVVLSTALISIILLNILIAYLSNLFSSLEENQAFDELREKASLILNLEIILRFFRYYLTRKTHVIREVEEFNYDLLISDDPEKNTKFKVRDSF
jgi:hypothetical protein